MNVPEKAEKNWPPSVIAGAYQTGVLAVRGLKKRGIDAICLDCNSSNPGFYSTYGPARLSPDPDTAPEAWVEFMLDLAGEHKEKPVLIPSSDKYVSAIAKHSDQLNSHYILSQGIGVQGMLAEKHTQYALAEKHGMPLPRTQIVDSLDELEELSKNLLFPCLIKPVNTRDWSEFRGTHPFVSKKVAIADNKSELVENYKIASEITATVIVQEIIEGPDTSKRVYLSVYNSESQRIANAMFKELRCTPLGFGPASVSEPVVDTEVDTICDQFLKNLSYIGICEIEVKRDSRDGKPKLIEVNPRLSGGGDAAPYDGVDLCWIHYLDLIQQPIENTYPAGRSFKHIVLRADAVAIPAYLRAGLITWRDIVRSYRPPLAFYDFDIRDLRYSAETIYIALRSFFGGFIRWLFRGGA